MSVTAPCTFCTIVGRTGRPHERVAETTLPLAFMNAHPAGLGHALVIPKAHAENIWELSTEDGLAVWELTRRVAVASLKAFNPQGQNLFQANGRAGWQSEFHFHIHVVPRWHDDALVPNWRVPQGRQEDVPKAADRLRAAL